MKSGNFKNDVILFTAGGWQMVAFKCSDDCNAYKTTSLLDRLRWLFNDW